MSNSVTTAIRGSVRDTAIGKTRTTEKADRATVEQVKYSEFNAFKHLKIIYMGFSASRTQKGKFLLIRNGFIKCVETFYS